MRCTPALLLLTLLTTTPVAHAARPTAPVIAAAQQLELEIAEVGKDGARRTTVLTLALTDRGGGSPKSEMRMTVRLNERERFYYRAKVVPDASAVGNRLRVELVRSEDSELRHPDLELDVSRVLPVGAPTQLSRVLRPDGSTVIVTATPR